MLGVLLIHLKFFAANKGQHGSGCGQWDVKMLATILLLHGETEEVKGMFLCEKGFAFFFFLIQLLCFDPREAILIAVKGVTLLMKMNRLLLHSAIKTIVCGAVTSGKIPHV